ncbi:MAG TPA: pyridoxal-phosphate dependent enzyme [Candidatus Thermoplasmatota archaeon]
MWRYAQVLPIDRAGAVSLGEGGTPLRDVPAVGASFKLEYLSPTGSFKDRGATVVVSKAKELGARVVVEDSSGNAGAAVAAYAARAGLNAVIAAPTSIVEAKAAAIEALGATLERVPGDREEVAARAAAVAKQPGHYYASHVMTPWFIEGTKTAAYEIHEEAGPDAFDAVVLPVGNGTLLLGLARGFAELVAAGLEPRVPRLVAVQPSGCSPLVDALGGAGPRDPPNTVADGTQIARPPRLSQMVEEVRASKGAGLRVGEWETHAARATLRAAGMGVEATSAMAVAGLQAARASGALGGGERALVMLTGREKGA